MRHLEGLNDRQKEAASHTEGPLLIIAGAGAGKTKTLTVRMLHLVSLGVAPSSILAITFTNKAAKEMRERVMSLLEADPIAGRETRAFGETPFVGTFHSLCVHILREDGHEIGIPKRFTIFDRDDSKRIVRQSLKDAGYDPAQYEPTKVLSAISKAKSNLTTAESFAKNSSSSNFFETLLSDIWRRYDAALAKEGALDFDDILLRAAILLRDKESVREKYQKRWNYVHVDEYQDTNKVQYQIARFLTAKSRNFCVVGDADQTIYTWRGATVDHILSFEKDYPDAKVVLLEQNYRSTKTILGIANGVIEKNKKRLKKRLFTEGAEGELATSYRAFDEGDEARFVARMASEAIKNGVPTTEIAVLYRANYQSRALEEAFLHEGVPYQVLGTRFFDRAEVKDLITYLRYALNPSNTTDLSRIANEPPRGIGKVTLLALLENRIADLGPKARESVANFQHVISSIQTSLATDKASDVIRKAIIVAGFEAEFAKHGDEGTERLENLRELVSLSVKYDFMSPPEGIQALIEDAALASDQDELQKDNGGVKLMTVHSSKGLEYHTVFVVGLEEGLFPHEAFGGTRTEQRDEEEERRLFYVAITRAKAKLFLTNARMRTVFGNKDVRAPSRFLDDVDQVYMKEHQEDNDTKRRSAIRDIFIDF